jgi:D-inositol-3-phosphate glycosyltransferase
VADLVATPVSLPRALRVAVLSMHTSPTGALGHGANGGLNVYVRECCAAFARRGIATDVFTRVPASSPSTQSRLGGLCRVVDVPIGAAGLDKYELVGEVEAFASAVAGFAAAEGTRYEVIHSHYWLSGAAACTLRAEWAAPWAHTAHTLALVKNRRLAPGDRPEPAIRELVEAEIARSADLLVVSTESEGEDLRRAYGTRPDRIAVVAPGVDLDAFQPVPRFTARRRLGLEGSRPILFAGRLERLKGAEVALRAFALVAPEHPNAVLVVLGGDSREDGESERSRLQAIAAELGVVDRVSFRGSVPHTELRLYYSAAEALLMPSYSESFGLVGLEAQACGCPVVAADVAGLASVVRDDVTGYLVPNHEPAEWADRLRLLLDVPELSEQMGRRARLLAQRFTWSRTADHLVAEYEALLEGGLAVAAGSDQTRVHAGARQE